MIINASDNQELKTLATILDFDKVRASTSDGYLGIKLTDKGDIDTDAPTGQNNSETKVIDGDLGRARSAVTQNMNQVWLSAGQSEQVIEVHTGGGQDYVNGGNADDVVYLGSGDDFVSGLNGNDWLFGEGGRDIIYGGLGDDYIVGGADGDLLRGDSGDDVIITGGTKFEEGDSEDLGDWAVGGLGDDQIYGSAARDFLNGGAGADIIYGNGGDDVILGDGDYLFRWSPKFVELYATETVPGYMDAMGVWHEAVTVTKPGGIEHRLTADGSDFEVKGIYSGSINDPNSYNWSLSVGAAAGHAHLFDFQAVHHFWFAGTVPIRLAEGGGNDFIDGGSGNDWIAGQTGADVIYGGSGDDIIYGDDIQGNVGDGSDVIDGGGGNDTIVGGGLGDIIVGGGGNDVIYGDYASADDLFGDDVINGGEGNDVIYGGGGDDYVDGGEGNDVIFGDYDLSESAEHDGDDVLIGGSGADVMYGGGGRDVMYSDKVVGSGQIEGDGQFDLMYGGRGNDTMYAGTGGDHLYGEEGNDTLIAGTGDGGIFNGGEDDDTMVIGSGRDNKFWGGAGRDSYVVSRSALADGSGSDILGDTDGDWLLIIDGQTLSGDKVTAVAENRWRLGQMEIAVSGNDLLIYAVTVNADGTAVKVGKELVFQNAAGQNSFRDLNLPGYTPPEPGDNRAPELSGSLGDQNGTAGQLISFGLPAGLFSDPDGDALTYHVSLANGEALPGWLVFDAATGVFRGLSPAGLAGQSLSLKLWASDGRSDSEALVFDLNFAPPADLNPINGTDGNDYLPGTAEGDLISGGAGNDRLYGLGGNDVLDGGAGDDYLEGGLGDDVYVFGRGYGHDTVQANDPTEGKRDVVRLVDLNPEDIEIGPVGTGANPNLIIRIKDTGETLTVNMGLGADSKYWIQAIEFADGTVWEREQMLANLRGTEGNDSFNLTAPSTIDMGGGNDLVNGSSGDDVIYGGAGNDRLFGLGGNDVLDGGAGDDYLEGGLGDDIYVFGRGYGNDTVQANDATAGKRDVVRLVGLNPEDVEIGPASSSPNPNLIIRIKDTGETLTVNIGLGADSKYWIQAIEFADGTVWEREQMLANLRGTEGIDNLTLTTPGTIDAGGGNDLVNGSSGDDVIYGGAGNDRLFGLGGNDVLDGGAGDDHLEGGLGDDIYVFGRGYGYDTVQANDATEGKRDVVRLVGLNPEDVEIGPASSSPNPNLIIRIKETGETLTVQKGLGADSKYWIQAIEFADGTVWEREQMLANLRGTEADDSLTLTAPSTIDTGGGNDLVNGSSGDDVIYGGAGNDRLFGLGGNDVLDGGAGDDYLEGGLGDDIYVFGRGYGYDTVQANDATAGKRDVVRLVGLNPEDVEIGPASSSSNPSLIIRIKDTGETLTVQSGLGSDSKYWIQAIEFADGTVWEREQMLVNLRGTEGIDSLTLTAPSTIDTGGGNDLVNGSSGDDVIYGGAGNDRLYGFGGNDVLVGGSGDDYLDGGQGDDSYLFSRGDGQDTINNSGGGSDKLVFEGLEAADLWFSRSGNNLLIGLIGSADQVKVNSWFTATVDFKIDLIEAGGLAIAEDQVAQMVQAMAALGAPGGADGSWTNEQREALNPILAAYWQPRI